MDYHTHRIHGAGIYANIGGIVMVNVTIYGIHGSYGIWFPLKIAILMWYAIFSGTKGKRVLMASAKKSLQIYMKEARVPI